MHPAAEESSDWIALTQVPGWPGWRFSVSRLDRTIAVTPPEAEFITARKWRAMPIGAVLRAASEIEADPWLALLRLSASMSNREGDRPYGGSTEHRTAVAYVYREALTRRARPKEAIMARFSVSEKTAERWITEARRRGALASHADEKRAAETEAREWAEADAIHAAVERRRERAAAKRRAEEPTR